MSTREFAYALNKILSEEIPTLQFRVLAEKIHPDKDPVYGIDVSLPETLIFAFKKDKCYIGMDDLGDKVEVYARYGVNGYKNFGIVTDPQQVLQPIEEYLNDVFEDVLTRTEDLDFFFSQELHDFLKYNNISSRTYKSKQPDLVLDHPDYPFTYIINFSEYNGDVLVMVERWEPSEQGYQTGEFFDGDQTELYRSNLSGKNQQRVFSEILAVLHKEGFK